MAGRRPKVKNRNNSTRREMKNNRKNNMMKITKGKSSSNEDYTI
jgi:hypothetical protein